MSRQHPHSIKTILTFAIAFVSISVTLLISAILYSQFSSTIRENATVSTREIVRQVNANLNYYTNDILTIAGYARDLAKQTNELSRTEIERRLSSIVDSRQDIVCLLLFDLEGNVLLSTTDAPKRSAAEIAKQTWFTRALGGEGNFISPALMSSSSSLQAIPGLSRTASKSATPMRRGS